MKAQSFPLDKPSSLTVQERPARAACELLQTIEKAETEIRDFAGPAPLDAIDLSRFTASKESLFARANSALSSPVLSLKAKTSNAMAWSTVLAMCAFGRLIAIEETQQIFHN